MVMNRLRKIDPVSYLLFASVYRDFQTIEDFEEEIRKLKQESSDASSHASGDKGESL
jgi:transcriptional repressor NrdR